MKSIRFSAFFCVVALVGVLSAQEGPRRGQIKKMDAAKRTVVITSDGKDITLEVNDQTRVVRANGEKVDDFFKEKSFAAGANVLFLADGATLLGIRLQPANTGKGPQRGKLVKIDLEGLQVTIKTEGKEIVAQATDDTRLFEASGDTLKARLASFKAGADVQFLIMMRDGMNLLVGMRLFQDAKTPPPAKFDSSKLVPLDELGNKEYQAGFKGGFYPDGKNTRPKAHEDAGLARAKS
ncbi:MAG TPA: hypothetical protein VFE62_15860, partial [Gemmataceae bacterium]|nr:hypothetical protein [Gemmataceae bacterium]